MKERKTKIGKLLQRIFSPIGKWFSRLWLSADQDVLKFAYLFTNEVKTALQTGVIPTIINLTNTKADDKLLFIANAELPKIITGLNLVQSITAQTTQEQARAIFLEIVKNFGVIADENKARLYTTIAAEIYIRIMKVKYNKDVKFGEAVPLVEGWFTAEQLGLAKAA